jgi:hypothetical protein
MILTTLALTTNLYLWDLLLIVAQPQVYKKQLWAASCAGKTHELLHCSWVFFHEQCVPAGPVRFKVKNALNRIRSNKINKYFLFLIVFYSKN